MLRSKATKGILLARVSTKEQIKEEKGHLSIPSQLEKGRKYAEVSGIEIVDEKQFNESAFKGNRPKFYKVLKEALDIVEKENEPVALLFDEVTRFTRRWNEVLRLDELKKEGKIELHFFGQDLIIHKNSKHNDLIQWEDWCAYARRDSLVKSGRTTNSFISNLARKRFPGYLPTGYLKGGEWDPERQPLILEAFELYADENYSVQKLTEVMRDKGLTTKSANGNPKPITKSNLLYMLNNRTYTGKKDWKNPETGKRDTLYEFDFKPIVSEELFNRVKKKLNEKSIRYSTRHSLAKFFKFRGLLTCGYCGCSLTPNDLSSNYKNKKPGEEVYYRCSYSKKTANPNYYRKKFGDKHSGVRMRKGKLTYNCPQLYWSEKEVEKKVREELEQIVYDKDMFEKLRLEMNKRFEAEVKLPQSSIETLRKEREDLEKLKRNCLRDMVMEEMVDLKEDLRDQVLFTKERIAQKKEEIERWEKVIDFQVDEFIDDMVMASDLVQQYDKLTPMNQHYLIQTAFSRISLRKGETMMTIGGKKKLFRMDGISFSWSEDFRNNLDNFIEEILREDAKRSKGGAEVLKVFLSQRKRDKEEQKVIAKRDNKDLNKKNISRERLSGHGFSPRERRAKP